ncbi:MAG: transposase [Bdellovibrionales bacterium]|nr:transposase [Bdellovibrionales bacterium]
MSNYLFFVKHAYKLKIHSFVLMNNHFHLIVTTPHGNLSEAMNYFMRETSKEFNRVLKREDQFYGSRYYRTLVKRVHYWSNVYKYVYRNPVQAGLSQSCEEYRFSTLHGLLGKSRMTIPIEEDHFLFSEFEINSATLKWLNETPLASDIEALAKALKRKEFFLPKNPLNKQPHRLEESLL